MKNRLQALWDKVVPNRGPCPQPDVKKVRRRVDAALDGKRHAVHLHRGLRLAALCAAALVLLTGAAAVVAEVALPEYSVLSVFFQGNAAQWENMVDTQPVSVSDGNYTLTLTSSVADRSSLFYTITVEAKSDEAWQALEERLGGTWYDLWSFRPGVSMSIDGSGDGGLDAETRTLSLGITTERTWSTHSAVRLELMDEGVWLNFTFHPVSDLRLKVNADGPARGPNYLDESLEGTVTLKELTLSPFTIQAKYTTESTDISPVLYFLWEDGTYTEVESMLGGDGHGSGHGVVGEPMNYTYSHSFRSVQDLSTLEAVVFGNTAYPLDHGEPYEADLSALPLREIEP